MAGEPRIEIVGNLTADPELRFTQNGKGVANLNVAVTPSKNTGTFQNPNWTDLDTMFFRVTVWGQHGENVVESLRRGQRVMVVGRLTVRSYETREGEKRQSWEISADEVTPSLKFATASVNKINRHSGGQSSTQEDPWATDAPARTAGGADQTPWNNEPPF